MSDNLEQARTDKALAGYKRGANCGVCGSDFDSDDMSFLFSLLDKHEQQVFADHGAPHPEFERIASIRAKLAGTYPNE